MIDRRNVASALVALGLLMTTAAPVPAEEGTGPDASAEVVAPAPAAPVGPPTPKPALKAKPTVPAKGIHLTRSTPVSKTVNVHDKVLSQCAIQTMLPQMIADRAPGVTLVDKAGGNRLELKIVDIHAPNGGWFSGPKWITVEGRLLAGGTLKGNFIAKETSMASATACGMLQKVMSVLAGDIAVWLDHPARNSRLGSAR